MRSPRETILRRKILRIKMAKAKKASKPKLRRRRVLCKVRMDFQTLIIYRDGRCRWGWEPDGGFHWKLAHSELGPIFLYNESDINAENISEDEGWKTDWQSNNEDEVRLAETIAKALADLEVEKMLKGDAE